MEDSKEMEKRDSSSLSNQSCLTMLKIPLEGEWIKLEKYIHYEYLEDGYGSHNSWLSTNLNLPYVYLALKIGLSL